MKGFQLEFFIQQDLYHNGKPFSDWLSDIARTHGIRGATVFKGASGFGHHPHLHATQLMDIAEHPIQVTMVVDEIECERLFALLAKEKLHPFYVKVPVEFGRVCEI